MNRPVFADVILPVPLHQLFTYQLSDEESRNAKPGCRVVVQFGSRKFYTGLIKEVHDRKPEYETKPIEILLDESPILYHEQIRFWEWISSYYMCSEGEIFKAALPAGLKLESQTILHANDIDSEEFDSDGINLSPIEEIVFQFVTQQKDATISQLNIGARKSSSVYPVVQSLLKKGLIRTEEQIIENYRPKTETCIALGENIGNEEQANQALNTLKRAVKQQNLLLSLLGELKSFQVGERQSVPKKELLKIANSNEAALKALTDRGYASVVAVVKNRIVTEELVAPRQFGLSEAQQTAFDSIKQQFEQKSVVLLHGVTASGKTEIYIKLIEEQLSSGKQVLFLMPEIALTSQMITRLTGSFGSKVGLYHSKFSNSERTEIWNEIQKFDPQNCDNARFQLVIGTRSSVFLPFKNLGLVIVDEEHENSFKQFDPAPRYNARDASVVLAAMFGAKTLMGTATPSFETFFNAKVGKYGYVAITKRFHDVEMPLIEIADVKDATKRKLMRSCLTPKLFGEIENALSLEKQVILFQNRRGFSSFVQCHECGEIPRCKQCDVSLTYHKFSNRLQCHYCGYSIQVPNECPKCHSTNIQTRGLGTEKIEDELNILFPAAKIGRLDLDSTRSKHGFEKIISQFERKEINILVGTQMVTKGLDFSNVSIVGIINADNLLNFPDFRAFERSYQLMAQVAGRAGRKEGRGKVVIQTYQADNPVVQCVVENDYEKMYDLYIDERKTFNYPPWCRLIYISVKHKMNDRVQLASEQLAVILRNKFGARVMGPEYPLIGRVQLYYIKVVRLKLERQMPLGEVKKVILEAIAQTQKMEQNRSVLFSIDVDPQ